MATHLTEEEQIEAFKRWWNENWVTVVLPLVVCIFLYVGWYWWQGHKDAQAALASEKYEEIMDMLNAAEAADGLTAKQKEELMLKAEKLVSEHSHTLYADFVNLIIGDIYVEDKELDKAANYINRVVQNGVNGSVSLLATSRLAKIYLNQGRYDEALMLVSHIEDKSFASIFSEIQGDILYAKGDIAAANTAYRSAMENLGPQDMSRGGLLQTKISTTTIAVEPLNPATAEAVLPAGHPPVSLQAPAETESAGDAE